MSHVSSNNSKGFRGFRHLVFESLEDRCMLTSVADVVLLVDNSSSDSQEQFLTKDWLKLVVTGDINGNGLKDAGELNLSDRLAAQGITDIRYGLVAYGGRNGVRNRFYTVPDSVSDPQAIRGQGLNFG